MPLLIAFFFGLLVGSFLNVCIIRLPKEESIVMPGSHCTSCGHAIAWYDNVPVVSFLALAGKCRHCKARISWQYAAIEILTGVLFALFYWRFGLSVQGIAYLLLSLALLVETMIDFKYQIIPDEITLPGIAIGVGLSSVFPQLQGETVFWKGFLMSLLGMLAGGGFLYAVGTIAEKVMKKEAMGGGDVKLLAMIGAFLGWQAVLWTVFVSSFSGAAIGIFQRLRGGDERMPFGPYLALGAFLYLFFGEAFIQWYFHLGGI